MVNTGVQKAVSRGTRMVYVPSMATMLGPWALMLVLFSNQTKSNAGHGVLPWAVLLFVIGLIGAWLAWSIQVPKWRLWAYRNVDNISELKEAAVAAGLIWPEGHFLEKTEIASRATRDELRALESRKKAR